MSKKSNKNWWEDIFDETYLFLFDSIYSQNRASKEVNFLLRNIKLNEGSVVIDAGCGQGRHSIALAKKGYHVLGIDASPALLRVAKQRATNEGLRIQWLKSDVRKISKLIKGSAVFMLGNSFGYFHHQDNVKLLRLFYAILKPNGWLVLDMPNTAGMLEGMIGRRSQVVAGGRIITENVAFNPELFELTLKWTFVTKKIRKSHLGFLRLYTVPEISSILDSIGFRQVKIMGSFNSTKFTIDSPRAIIVCRK